LAGKMKGKGEEESGKSRPLRRSIVVCQECAESRNARHGRRPTHLRETNAASLPPPKKGALPRLIRCVIRSIDRSIVLPPPSPSLRGVAVEKRGLLRIRADCEPRRGLIDGRFSGSSRRGFRLVAAHHFHAASSKALPSESARAHLGGPLHARSLVLRPSRPWRQARRYEGKGRRC